MQLSDATLFVFTVLSGVRVVAYVPQIAQALRDNAGCKAISTTTWLLFLISHLATMAYALVNLGDSAMALVFGANAVCCGAILAIVWQKRVAFKRAGGVFKPDLRVIHSAEPKRLARAR